jgi:hypothetical protein
MARLTCTVTTEPHPGPDSIDILCDQIVQLGLSVLISEYIIHKLQNSLMGLVKFINTL